MRFAAWIRLGAKRWKRIGVASTPAGAWYQLFGLTEAALAIDADPLISSARERVVLRDGEEPNPGHSEC